MDGGEAILDAFRRLGVDYVISSPGSEWAPVWEALARQTTEQNDGPRYVNCWHETLAVSIAIGYTRATGRMQAILLHTGVGLLQGSLAIRSAYMEQVPILICVGESSSYGEDPNFDIGPNWLTEHAGTGGPSRYAESFAKWAETVKSPATLYRSVIRAGEISMRMPQGPVVLSIPMEIMAHDWVPPARRPIIPPPPRYQPEQSRIIEAASLLQKSQSPVIITEACGRSAEAFERLKELCEFLAIPLVETDSSLYSNFPKDHSLHVGYSTKEILHRGDLFIVISARNPWYPPGTLLSEKSSIVALDENPIRHQAAYQSLQADMYIEGDVASTLTAITKALRSLKVDPSLVTERRSGWEAYHKMLRESYYEEALRGRDKKPIDPAWLCSVINEVMPKDTVYVTETTVHRSLILRHINWNRPRSYFRTGSGGLGIGLGLALGVKLALHQRLVACLIGDGAFLYNPVLPCLGASVEYNLPILVIIFNNGGYASMRATHLNWYPKGVSATSKIFYGYKINSPNYTEFARSFGGHSERIEEPRDLKAAMQRGVEAVNDGKLAVIDVVLEPEPPA